MENYRSLPRIANSDLTELKNKLFGMPDSQSSPTQEFGTRFHDLLLLETGSCQPAKGLVSKSECAT